MRGVPPWVFAIIALFGIVLFLNGCAVCTYKGKAVSKKDAEHMRTLGMHVICTDVPANN